MRSRQASFKSISAPMPKVKPILLSSAQSRLNGSITLTSKIDKFLGKPFWFHLNSPVKFAGEFCVPNLTHHHKMKLRRAVRAVNKFHRDVSGAAGPANDHMVS